MSFTLQSEPLAVTTGLVSLFVGNRRAGTIVYTIPVMGSQVVEHLMRTPGFTPCLYCRGKRPLLATGQRGVESKTLSGFSTISHNKLRATGQTPSFSKILDSTSCS